MSRLKKIIADESNSSNRNEKSDINYIESNPDNGIVLWDCLNKANNGIFVSYNAQTKQFFCFDNFDSSGLNEYSESVRVNKRSLKETFESAKRKARRMVVGLTINFEHGFKENEIVSLDNFVEDKKKRPDEIPNNFNDYIPNISEMFTRYVPNQRESGENAGHIYGIYYNKASNSLVAMNIDANGNMISQEPLLEDQQETFNKVEESIIKAMDNDSQWYTRNVENSAQSLGLNINENLGPWTEFNEEQIDEQTKRKEEEQKQEEKERLEDEKDEEKNLDEPSKNENSESNEHNDPVVDTNENYDNYKHDRNKDEERLYSTNIKTIAILFEGKDLSIINQFASGLNKDKLILGYEILPGYTYKKANKYLGKIVTSLLLMNKYAYKSKSNTRKYSIKSRLRKLAYNYVNIVNELASDLITDSNNIDVASVYFSNNNVKNSTDTSACGFIVIYNNKYIAFGPNSSDDIVDVDTDCIREMKENNPDENIGNLDNPKIDINTFVNKVESMNLSNIKVFSSIIEAEEWINKINNNSVKGRLIINNAQEFSDDSEWNNIDNLGENPDINSEDIKSKSSGENSSGENSSENDSSENNSKEIEEPIKTDQDKWNELSDNDKTWQLRITYKNWPAAKVKINEFIQEHHEIIKNIKDIVV